MGYLCSDAFLCSGYAFSYLCNSFFGCKFDDSGSFSHLFGSQESLAGLISKGFKVGHIMWYLGYMHLSLYCCFLFNNKVLCGTWIVLVFFHTSLVAESSWLN